MGVRPEEAEVSTENILITGVSSGLGHALARQFLRGGHPVFGMARRWPEDLGARTGFRFRSIDLGRLDQVPGAVRELVPSGTHFPLAILNAGILGEAQDLSESTMTQLHRIMDINVWSNKVLLDSLASIQSKVDQVVLISSGAAVKGNRGWGGYAISKAALNMLTQVLAAERPETHFTALAPGLIDTAMQKYIRSLPDTPEYVAFQRLKAAHGTAEMPDAMTAADRLIQVLPALREKPSGAFLDLRQLAPTS